MKTAAALLAAVAIAALTLLPSAVAVFTFQLMKRSLTAGALF